MFTGLVEEIGIIKHMATSGSVPLRIGCNTVLEDTKVGDSIAVNGVCLTVTNVQANDFAADLQPVTRRLSNLGELKTGDQVNLERSVRSGDRFGGHYVQGHIDGKARIVALSGEGASLLVRLSLPDGLMRYVVDRGFIAVDGASLTVMRLWPDGVEVSLVDHTLQSITLPGKRRGSWVNVEVDAIAKYVERLLGAAENPEPKISVALLRQNGFA